MVCNQWLRQTNTCQRWSKKIIVPENCSHHLDVFSPQIMMKYYQIKPKDVARRRHTLAHSALTMIMLVKPMIPMTKMLGSGVKKNCPPHWRGTWVCQRLRCPLMLNGELWWIIIFGNRFFFCNGDGIEKTSQDHLEPELPTDYILYQMIPLPGDTSSSTLSLATNV